MTQKKEQERDVIPGSSPDSIGVNGAAGIFRPGPTSGVSVQELQQRANACYQAGRIEDALAACRDLLTIEPNRPDVLGFAGMAALKLGKFAEAAELYEAAISQRPDFAEAHYNFGNALKSLGRLEAAAAAYRQASTLRPDILPAHHNLGSVLQTLERFEEAADAYRRVLAVTPDTPDTLRNLGMVLQKLGRPDEAIAAYRRAIEIQPERLPVYSNLVTVLMEQGDAHTAVEVCDQWLGICPDSTEALARKAVALIESDDRATARLLLDFDRFVRATRPKVPPGYASLTDFNEALARHVCEHPTLKVPPKDDPTYHHPQLQITEELLVEPKGPIADLERVIRAAIGDYRRMVLKGTGHPFVENWPQRWRLSSWGVVLNGQGNLVPHIHLDGFMGGVYYVELPDVVDDPGQNNAGWFELGRPPPELNCTAEPEVQAIQPEVGKMLLFPAYFYHRTVPFEAPQRRISIAFDVVPERRERGLGKS